MAYVAIVGVVSESFRDGCLWRGFWKSFGDLLGDVWGRLGASRGSLGWSWEVLGSLGGSWDLLGAVLGPSRSFLGDLLGVFWESWGRLGDVLGHPVMVFFRLGAVLEAMWHMMSFLGWFRRALGMDFH